MTRGIRGGMNPSERPRMPLFSASKARYGCITCCSFLYRQFRCISRSFGSLSGRFMAFSAQFEPLCTRLDAEQQTLQPQIRPCVARPILV